MRMEAAGICGTDLHSYRASAKDYPPLAEYVPGHEPCGVIIELGADVPDWSVGDRVVVYHRITCLRCAYCRNGLRNLCRNHRGVYGFGPDGADAQLMVANAQDLLALPDEFSYVEGMLLACQVGTAYSPLKVMGVSGLDTLVVSGLGPVGLLTVLVGAAMGARVVGIDPSDQRRALAEGLGADVVVDPGAGPVRRAVHDLCPGGADKLVEASGAAEAQAGLVRLLRPRGQAAIVGLGSGELRLRLMPLVSDEIRVFGSSLYPASEFDEIVAFIRRKRVPITDVVTDEVGIEDAPAAFEVADLAGGGKVVFRFG